jgi:hypothetical protein
MGFILADQVESCVFHLVVGSPDRCEKPNRFRKLMTVAAASDSTSNRKSTAIIPVNSVIQAFAPRVSVPLTFTLAALAFALVAPGIALDRTDAPARWQNGQNEQWWGWHKRQKRSNRVWQALCGA